MDQIGHVVLLKSYPKRIISVVPSQTELLHYLGLKNEVVGITKFCVHPDNWYKKKVRVGGTKNLNINRIESLKPDLIIANKEENTKEQIFELQKIFPVWTSDITNLDEAIDMIYKIGQLTSKEKVSLALSEQIIENFQKLKSLNKTNCRVLYLIWKSPYMSVGNNTFINDMLVKCGFVNVMGEYENYPELTFDQILKIQPDIIFLSSEPYPFKREDMEDLKKDFPSVRICLVDGEAFSWYGSRLKQSPQYFVDLMDKMA